MDVATLGPGRSFGELALMYNCPRNASVISATPAKLWALDRTTFRHILANSSAVAAKVQFVFLCVARCSLEHSYGLVHSLNKRSVQG